METKGLLVYVYKNTLGDCTNNGISCQNDRLILVGQGVDCQVFNGDETNTVKIAFKHVGDKPYIYCAPITETPKNMIGPMFGGNFVYCSDSRFPSKQPIPIHDRYEECR